VIVNRQKEGDFLRLDNFELREIGR
jgi:hypothetical protein